MLTNPPVKCESASRGLLRDYEPLVGTMSWCCDYDDFQLLPIEWLNRIWRPDSYFKNAKQVTFQTMTIPNHYVWLYRTKKIFYMVK